MLCGVWRRLWSSFVVVIVCNTQRRRMCNVTHQGAARDGEPVVLHPVSPVHTSDNVAETGDIVAPRTAALSPKTATLSQKPATLCFWQQCCRFRRQCRGFWRQCRWCGRGFRATPCLAHAGVGHINEVTHRRVWLILRWLTVCGYTILLCNQSLWPTHLLSSRPFW